jgi:hypothetical protein
MHSVSTNQGEAVSKIKLSVTGFELTLDSEEVNAPEFTDNRHIKVVCLSDVNNGRF